MMIRPTLLVLFCLVAAVRAQNLTHGPGEIPRRNVGSLDGVPLCEVPRIDAAALQSLHTHQREHGPGRYAEPWNLHIYLRPNQAFGRRRPMEPAGGGCTFRRRDP